MHLNEIIKQKADEQIIAVIRRHPFTYVGTVLLYIILAIIPVALYFGIKQIAPDVLQNAYTNAIIVLIFSAFELSVALFFYASFLVYYLDMLIVTNDRFVEVSQRNLFSRTVSEMELFKIQDVTSEVTGVIATIFNYGTITVQTAGEAEEFKFEGVPAPNDLRRKLMDLADQSRASHHGNIGPQDIHP